MVGDSYAAGDVLDDRGDRWTARLADSEGIGVEVNGIGYTGFTNPGPCGGQAFADRADQVLAREPETLVIEGGLNDTEADPDDVRSAADDLLSTTGEVPEVVLVGPALAPERADGAQEVDAVLVEVAAQHDRPYVSMTDADLTFAEDGVHLTPEGHAAFAERVSQALGAVENATG